MRKLKDFFLKVNLKKSCKTLAVNKFKADKRLQNRRLNLESDKCTNVVTVFFAKGDLLVPCSENSRIQFIAGVF